VGPTPLVASWASGLGLFSRAWPWAFCGLVAGALAAALCLVVVALRLGVDVLRAERHRILNQLQVVAGWLELGRPERAAAQLADVIEGHLRHGRWLRSVPLWAQGLWWILASRAERRGVVWQWDGAGARAGDLLRLFWVLARLLRPHGPALAAIRVAVRPGGFVVGVEGDGLEAVDPTWCRGAHFLREDGGGRFWWGSDPPTVLPPAVTG
jgi:hypothetical protein